MASFVAARKAVSAVVARRISSTTTTALYVRNNSKTMATRTFASAAPGNGAAELNAGTG